MMICPPSFSGKQEENKTYVSSNRPQGVLKMYSKTETHIL